MKISLSNGFFLLVFLSLSTQAAPDFKIPDKVCSWRSVSFENISTTDSLTLDSFMWYFEGAQNEYTDTNVAVWVDIQTSKSVTVKLTQFLKNGDSLTQSKIVNVLESAGASFISPTVCDGDTAVFTNTSISRDIKYGWNFGDGAYDTGFHAKHLYEIPKEYNVTLIPLLENECSDAKTRLVTVNPLPDASFTYEINGRTVEFDGPPGNDLYRWTFGEGGRDDSEDPVYTYVESPFGNEVCLATRVGECWSEECQLLGFIGIAKSLRDSVTVYPNPAQGIFTIDIAGLAEIIVFDSKGKIINPLLKRTSKGYNVGLSEFPAGTYTVKVIQDGTVVTRQIMLL